MINSIFAIKTGEEWQDICNKVFCLHYEQEGYQTVPDTYGGDLGIEGFTRTGKLFQCYFPEGDYTSAELNTHLQKKMTNDIKKLLENGKELSVILNDIKVHKWIFVIPNYSDKKILSHAMKKKNEVKLKKKKDSLDYIADDFDILIYHDDHFALEFQTLATVGEVKTDLTDTKYSEQSWKDCDASLIDNIKRKINNVFYDSTEDAENVISQYLDAYAKGVSQIMRLQNSNPHLFDDFNKIKNSQERKIELQCKRKADNNNDLFFSLLDDFELRIKEKLGRSFSDDTIEELKDYLISDWLMRCPLDFKPEV